MKYKSNLQKNFQTGSKTYFLHGKQSANPLRYALEMAGREITGGQYHLDREGYHSYLLNFTARGGATLEYNGQTYNLSAGDLTFIDCNRRHKFYSNKSGWEFIYLHCNGPALPELYSLFQTLTGNVFHRFSPDVFLDELSVLQELLEIHPELLTPAPVEIDEALFTEFSQRVYKILNDLWLQINNFEKNVDTDVPQYVRIAREYVRANYTEKLTLEEVAKAAYISPWRLAHQFKRYTGVTVGEMIADLRLKHAVELLSTTNKKVVEIAAICGYTDTQMLNRIVKQNFALTPKPLRKTVQSGENIIGKTF